MSKKAGGKKRRRHSNMRYACASRWDCPGCGAKMKGALGSGVRHGDFCGACAHSRRVPGAARCVACGRLLSNPQRGPCANWRDHDQGTA